jgi:hypothetical protein
MISGCGRSLPQVRVGRRCRSWRCDLTARRPGLETEDLVERVLVAGRDEPAGRLDAGYALKQDPLIAQTSGSVPDQSGLCSVNAVSVQIC